MRSSTIKHGGPTSGIVQYWIGRIWVTLTGWQVVGDLPQQRRVVMIAAPHTSNWDAVVMVAAAWVFRLRLNWIGKKTLFRGLIGVFLRSVGGLPIDRSKPGGQVVQVADLIERSDRMYLAIAPAGTRSKRPHWRSGFYHIALAAGVPIVLGFIDWGSHRVGVGEVFEPSGDLTADIDHIRAFYDGMKGKDPSQQTPILLKEEID
jgi:1-acyl-sn-glycerol-3-phosphate acyltransferase